MKEEEKKNSQNKVRVAIMPEFQNYIIYSDNRFYNRKNNIWLNTNKRTKDGYLRVTLKSDKGEIRTFLCHRLIW
jgi:hypothetical protein